MQHISTWRMAAVVTAGLVLLQSPEHASAATFDCRGIFTSVATVPTVQTTSSTTLANIPGASLTVNADACVRVQFSAQVRAPGGLRFRLVMDGAPAGVPAATDFRSSGDGYDNHVATFIVRNAGSQQRILKIQYSSIDGKPVRVTKGVMTVWYTEPSD